MIITKDIRNQIFDTASIAMVYLHSHYSSGEKLYAIAESYNLTEREQYKKFATTVGDIILGFYRIEDTVPLLQQELGIDATTAGLLGADVLEFLAPLSDPNFVVPEEEDDEAEEATATSPVPAPATHSSATFYIPPTNGSIPVTAAAPVIEAPHIPELRTMADDMARSPERTSYEPIADTETPVYTSEQPPVRTPLSDLPAYTSSPNTNPPTPPTTSIETPRWGA